ncbi:hypothetical protein NHX12_022799 [Muraenolepis orangiensis]|uniref:Leucine-rich repeat-containing protein 27 n=1 Tax=Muraenolepis orangiensis TaxID=630683 RepID=A0A9Q0IRM4_9TELE|nr:hypothetical protein NHX12_022799 [Muraenolepis orangiensis]
MFGVTTALENKGNVLTLKGLNLRNCPIRSPPQDIVHQGLERILQYLRSAMAERPVSVQRSHPDLPPVEKLRLSELVKSSVESCGDEEEEEEEPELQRFRELKHKMILLDRAELGHGSSRTPRTHGSLPVVSERVARDRELEQRIHKHMQVLQERRRKPKGTVEEEKATAEQDMRESLKLQQELLRRKQDKREREYRFTAFTGDILPADPNT